MNGELYQTVFGGIKYKADDGVISTPASSVTNILLFKISEQLEQILYELKRDSVNATKESGN